MRLAFELQAANDEPTDSDEEKTAYANRIVEFWDVVNMSFSLADQDKFVTTYKSLAPPRVLNRNWLWCPVVEPTRSLRAWLEYSPRVREAIRLAFRRGLGLQTDFHRYERFEDWLEVKPGLLEIVPPMLNLIGNEAKVTKQYALARERLEFILNAIYKEARHIPYHPAFDNHFTTHLAATPLHDVVGFLSETCLNYGLRKSEGLAYLTDLVTDAAYVPGIASPDVISRAQNWLRGTLLEGARNLTPLANAPDFDNQDINLHSQPLLSPEDRVVIRPFSLNEAFQLAVKLEITNEKGEFLLGPRGLGAVVGFCVALKEAGRLSGSIADMTAVIGPLLGADVKTRKATTGVAQQYFRLTEKALDLSKKVK